MKGKLFCLLALLIGLYSCNTNKKEKIEYNRDGSIKKKTVYTSDDRDQYREWNYYSNNQIESIGEYNDGIKHGRSFSYYENGNIKSVFYFDMGKLTSVGRYYSENGLLTDKGLFINDSLVVKEEFLYSGGLMEVYVFSKLNDFRESGSLLYNNKGQIGLDNSYYFIVQSLDSIPADDSLKINLNFIAPKEKGARLSLALGDLDENLQFSEHKRYESDTLELSFYYSPQKPGYNLILGKLYYQSDNPAKENNEFIFYHDFLTY